MVWEREGFAYPLVQMRARSGSGVLGPIVDVASGDHPVVAVNAAGTSAIAWARDDAFGDRVRLSMRAADGTLTTPINVSPAGSNVDAIDVGIAADGTALAVWRRDGRIQARVRQPDGTLGPVETLSGTGAAEPVVAVAPSGEAAAAWRLDDGAVSRIEIAQISAAGVVGATRALTTSGVADSPDVGVADSGAAVVVWHRPVDGVDRIQLRPVAADGTAGSSQNLSPQGSAAVRPAVAVNPSGGAMAVWQRLVSGFWRVQAIPRSADGVLGTRVTLSSGGGDALFPEVDLSNAGLGVVVWDRVGGTTYAQARSLQLDGTVGLLATIGNGRENVKGQPLVDLNETGGSMTSWHRFDGSVLRVRIAVGAPQVTTTTTTLAHAENDTQPIDPGLKVIDESAQLTGATVAITENFAPEDELGFTDQNGITGSYDSGTGVLTLSGIASLADYQAALRSVTYHDTSDAPSTATREVTFTANDAAFTGRPGTRAITVTPVNDAPVITLTPGNLAYTEGATTPVDDQLTVTDADSASLTGATVEIIANLASSEDELDFTPNSGMIGSYDAAAGTLTLTGTATVAQYESALRSVTYHNSSDSPSTGTRTVRFRATDGSDQSAPETRDIDITTVDDAPTLAGIEAASLAYTENDAATAITSSLTVADPDSANLASATVQVTGNYVNGQDLLSFDDTPAITGAFDAATGTLTLTGSAPVADYQTALRAVRYRNSSDSPSTADRTVTFKASDGTAESAGVTRDITIAAVDDAPTLTTSAGSTAYTEQDPATTVDNGLVLADPDGGSPTGATVKITAPAAGDSLVFTDQNGITGSFAAGTLTLSGSATPAQYEAALRSVQFVNSTNDAPGTSRSIEFQITAPTASNTATKALAITPVNDAPSTDPTDAAASALEQTATAVDSGITVSDPDSANLNGATVQITSNFQAGQDTLQFSNQNGITGNFSGSTLTLTGSSSVANYQTALRSVTYTNSSDTPNTLTRTITFRVSDDETPSLQSTAQTRDLNVVPVNDAPTDAGESQNATGNTRLEVELTSGGSSNPTRAAATGNLLDNATDVDDAAAALSVDTATVSDPPHGTITVNADGSVVYMPDAGYTGPDSFTYRVKDDDNAQSGLSTVSITVATRIWYVRADAAAGGDGRSETPFNTLNPADTAANATGDTIYVFRKSGDAGTVNDASVDLLATQRLLGSAVDLTDGGATLYDGSSGLQPSLTDTSIKLDDGNTVRGLAISGAGSGAEAIEAGAGDASGTLDQLSVSGSTGGIELANGAGGTWDLSDLSVDTTGGDAIVAASAGTVNFASGGTISVTAAGGRGLNLSATTTSGTVDSTTVTSSPSDGIKVDDDPGSLTLNDINLTTTGAGLDIDSSNDVTVSGGDADITSSGTAVNLTTITSNPANSPDVTLDQVTSTGGATGVNIDDIAAGTFSANGGTLSGHTGAEIDVNAGSGNISYGGTIGNGTGLSSQITGRSGGTITLSGNINDSNDAGGGIDMSGNSGGAMTFSGGTKTLNTGAGAGFASTGSSPTINLTGGGLDIDTASGNGLSATGGGTVNVTTGANANTIDTTTGTALNVANTAIGAAGMTLRSISANGASSGIVLNNTGASGGLTVTGAGNATQGGDNSGGTIQSTTGHGISLTNTSSPSFRNVRLLNTGDSGVNGTQVSGFSFTDSTITGAGNASDENSVTFDDSLTSTPNLTGAVTITNNVISQTEAEGVDIENWGGTITDANISNNALSDTGDVATPGSAITLIDSGTATSAANLTKATVANNTITDFRAGVGVQVRAGNPSAGGPTGSAGTAGNATNIIAVTGNSMNGGNAGIGNQPDRFFTGGVSGNGGQGNFNVSNNGTAGNRIRNIDCIAIEMQMDGPVTMTSTVSNNFINANSAVGCAGIAVGTDDPSDLGAGTHSTLISSNNVMGTDGPGIFPIVRDSGSSMTARVLNNTVAAPITTNAARAGIRVDSGSSAGDTTMCLEISGNNTAGSTNSGTATTSPGINLRKQGTDPTINTFGIEGLSPSPTGTPTVENWVNSQNTSTSGTFGVGGTALLSAQTGFTSCTAP